MPDTKKRMFELDESEKLEKAEDFMDHTRPENSRHVSQVLAPENKHRNYKARTDISFGRILDHDEADGADYHARKGEMRSTLHWGQRKLMLSEVEFLTLYAKAGTTVLYAGAAPGTHLNSLSQLFPKVTFECIDPARFTAHETKRVRLHQCLFTDDIAETFADRERYPHVLFISDVRTADPSRMKEQAVEHAVCEDMEAQQRWHLKIAPARSMLKFRLPWAPGITTYLDGDIYLPVWGPQATTEARLVTHEEHGRMREYDNTQYERQMMYFNTVTRVGLYPHPVGMDGTDHVEGAHFCHCYDCTAEVTILMRYSQKFALTWAEVAEQEVSYTRSELAEKVASMSCAISRGCHKERTLRDAAPEKKARQLRIEQSQYIGGMPAHEYARMAAGGKPGKKRQKR